MFKTKVLVIALGAAFALPAMAEVTPSSNVSLVSDYIFRGISQSGANPGLQGGFDLAHSSGLYAGLWGASISTLSDAGVAAGSGIANAGLELDTYFGYKGAAGVVSYDVGFLRYNYPGTYAAGVTKADTDELYAAVSYSILTAKLSNALGDTFGVSKAAGTTYLELNASYALPDTGITLGAHYGVQTYKGTTADASKAAGNDPSYADYKLSASKDFSGYVVGVAFSSTVNTTPFYTNVQNTKLGKSTTVLSLSRAF